MNIDSTVPNLALAKLEKYYSDLGYSIKYDLPIYREWANIIFVSCVFSKNAQEAQRWNYSKTIIGGSGWDLSVKLDEEIEKVKPKINLGFTTRGCIRKCPFCIVNEKEGKFKVVGDLLDLWDGKSKEIKLLDNNILVDKDHFFKICNQARENKIKLDFNQGLDFRLIDQKTIDIIKTIRHQELRFAFDNIYSSEKVLETINLLKQNGINKCLWYVLVGFDSTPEQDLYRLDLLKENNQDAFVQRYDGKTNKFYTQLARWANQHNIFRKMSFDEFNNKEKK